MVQGEDAGSGAAGRQQGDRAAQLLPTTVPNRNPPHRAILHVCQVTRGRWHRRTWSAGRAVIRRCGRSQAGDGSTRQELAPGSAASIARLGSVGAPVHSPIRTGRPACRRGAAIADAATSFATAVRASAAATATLRHALAPLLRRGTPRPPRARPAGRRDGTAGPGPVRGPGWQREDHDARGARRLARRCGGRRPGDHRGDHLQHARGGGAPGTSRPGARAARGGGRRGAGTDVPRPGPRDPPRRRGPPGAPRARCDPPARLPGPRRGRPARGSTARSRG